MSELVEIVQTLTILSEQGGEVVETLQESVLAVDVPNVQVAELEAGTTLLEQGIELQLVSEGTQGPPGASEDEMVYSKRVDFVGDTVIYRGEAPPGSLESVAVWRIRRITFSPDGDVTEEWAGQGLFTQVWSDRASLSYI